MMTLRGIKATCCLTCSEVIIIKKNENLGKQPPSAAVSMAVKTEMHQKQSEGAYAVYRSLQQSNVARLEISHFALPLFICP